MKMSWSYALLVFVLLFVFVFFSFRTKQSLRRTCIPYVNIMYVQHLKIKTVGFVVLTLIADSMYSPAHILRKWKTQSRELYKKKDGNNK